LNQIKGNGSILLQDGVLGNVNLLKGVLALLLIPEYRNIIFTQARAGFDIVDGKIVTEDLSLTSEPLDIYGKGWLDFKQKVNLDLAANFKDDTIRNSTSILRAPTAILTKASGFVGVKVRGTLAHPQYETTLLPEKILEKTTNAIFTILDDLVQ
jgi:hypothetical protein